MNWSDEARAIVPPAFLGSPDEDGADEGLEREDERPGDFDELPATAKVPSLKKLLAGDAKRSVERDKEEDDDVKPN